MKKITKISIFAALPIIALVLSIVMIVLFVIDWAQAPYYIAKGNYSGNDMFTHKLVSWLENN